MSELAHKSIESLFRSEQLHVIHSITFATRRKIADRIASVNQGLKTPVSQLLKRGSMAQGIFRYHDGLVGHLPHWAPSSAPPLENKNDLLPQSQGPMTCIE